MSKLVLDFVLYLGDPDEGAEAVRSAKAVEVAQDHKEALTFPEVYGAIVFVDEKGEELCPRRPDPIFQLVTNMVKAVPYIIEGEAETTLLSESEHGLIFEPSGDDVHVSYFAGDAYEPDEYLVNPTSMTMSDFGEQILSMGERLKAIIEKVDPDVFDRDDYSKSLIEFLEVGREAHKTFQLEVERGLRIQ